MRWTKYVLRLVLYPMLVFGGFHTLLTGSPIPLWHIERLNNAVAVTSATVSHLALADGRQIALPFITQLPHDNPLFQASISDGIELNEDGT
ncbi:MAG TPA: hypothetical protein VMM76_24580 [Pirellulaceae bacterium]|nr:hypothetical protein [Pirellulaceae bacterium]